MKSHNEQLRKRILRLLSAPKYRPLDKTELKKAIEPENGIRSLNAILRQLEQSGEIARIRKNQYVLPSAADLVTGKLQVHQRGFAFLSSEKPGRQDLYISAENTGTALNGDKVVARIISDKRQPPGRDGRTEGRVIRILERANDSLVGTLQRSKNFFYVVPDDPRIGHDVYVQVPSAPPLTRKPEIGDKVVVRLEPWESRHVNPEGQIVEVLGPSSAPGVDMLSVIRKYNLPTEFPEDVLEEANEIPETITPEMLRQREDLREQFVVTIDPDDARDFDDAIQVERTRGGGWRLGVHIADVAAYVIPGRSLDREASRRGNSVYLPDRVIPMLPERLSNGVCSLNPGVDRLTYSVFLQFAKDGRLKTRRFTRSVIRSAYRLTYRQAHAILSQPAKDQLGEQLHVAWELAALLRRKRFEQGSLDLDFPEVKVKLDAQGIPIRLERIENDESHQLVEEFMLAANEAVASELRNCGLPTVYRVHEIPDPEKLAEYRDLVLSFHYQVGDLTNRRELQRLLAAFTGKPEEQALKIGLLKSLKRARYAVQPLGHFGLAKNNYTHFTSPIRRYADLVVHRTLAHCQRAQRRGPIESGEMTKKAEHISTTERTAAEAEMDAVKMKQMEFFERQLQIRNPQVFRAVIIDIRNYGLLIELPDIVMTGLVHISSLIDDFYMFNPTQRQFVGRRSRHRFSIGDQLQVFVARVDRFKQQVDFAIAPAKPGKNPLGRQRTKATRTGGI